MHSLYVITLLGLPIASLATPLQVTLSCFEGNDAIRPAWEKENRQLIVPLTRDARTGLVDPTIEEGLIATLGTRFVNALYSSNDSETVHGTASLKCIKNCGLSVLKSAPCLAEAVLLKNVNAVVKCVSKDALCRCANCLPDAIQKFVKETVCTQAFVDNVAEADRFSPYVDFMALADNSVDLQAFRGELYEYQVEQLKALNRQSQSMLGKGGEVHANARCFVGSGCAGCSCCVGGCVADSVCIGVCAS